MIHSKTIDIYLFRNHQFTQVLFFTNFSSGGLSIEFFYIPLHITITILTLLARMKNKGRHLSSGNQFKAFVTDCQRA